jgi:hypothetical protein
MRKISFVNHNGELDSIQLIDGQCAEWVYWGNGYTETSRYLADRGFVNVASDHQWERDLFVGPAEADIRDMPYQG